MSDDSWLEISSTMAEHSLESMVRELAAECKLLRAKCAYDQSAIQELLRQREKLSSLLSEAQSALSSVDPPTITPSKWKPTTPHPSYHTASSKTAIPDWIGGTWQTRSESLLVPIEAAWIQRSTQSALARLSKLQASADYPLQPLSLRVNASLLHSAILRSSSSLEPATGYAEEALHLALGGSQDQALIGKARFHRGLCYLYAERWAEASWSFQLAQGTEEHEKLVKEHLQIAEKRRMECELGEEGSVIPVGFV